MYGHRVGRKRRKMLTMSALPQKQEGCRVLLVLYCTVLY